MMAGEMQRTEAALRLPRPLEGYVGDHFVLDPAYVAEWGTGLGCLCIRAGLPAMIPTGRPSEKLGF